METQFIICYVDLCDFFSHLYTYYVGYANSTALTITTATIAATTTKAGVTITTITPIIPSGGR